MENIKMAEIPLLSIITVNYNDQKGLKKTFQSIFDQTYQDFEYIVIDGGSKDGSKELIEEYQDKIGYWVSEPDKGIYNAMNKGIVKATGKYVIFLNSGDSFYNPEVLFNVVKNIQSFDKEYAIVYGDVIHPEFMGKKNVRRVHPDILDKMFFFKSTINHQAAFIEKRLFDENHLYKEQYKIVADWEFFMHVILQKKESYKHIDLIICEYSVDGFSSNNGFKSLWEEKKKAFLEINPTLYKKLWFQNKINNLKYKVKTTFRLNG